MVALEPKWIAHPEFWSANRAEYAVIGSFELVAFDLPPMDDKPGQVGWELFGGSNFQDLISTGLTKTFEEAQTAAEIAWRAQTISH